MQNTTGDPRNRTEFDAGVVAKALAVGEPTYSKTRVGLGLGPWSNTGVDGPEQWNGALFQKLGHGDLARSCSKRGEEAKAKKKTQSIIEN